MGFLKGCCGNSMVYYGILMGFPLDSHVISMVFL